MHDDHVRPSVTLRPGGVNLWLHSERDMGARALKVSERHEQSLASQNGMNVNTVVSTT